MVNDFISKQKSLSKNIAYKLLENNTPEEIAAAYNLSQEEMALILFDMRCDWEAQYGKDFEYN